MADYTWCSLTVKEFRDILSQYPEDARVELGSLGEVWSSAELTIYDPKTKVTETIMEVNN